jgi:hypothetical protein
MLMQIHAMLETRRAQILTELETLQAELSEIDRMMSGGTVVTARGPASMPTSKDEAIITAIAEGNRTPAAISDYIKKKLGLPVNPASTRTRLSRMKSAEKIDHDGLGWKLK